MTKGEARKLVKKQETKTFLGMLLCFYGVIVMFVVAPLIYIHCYEKSGMAVFWFGIILIALGFILDISANIPFTNPDTKRICQMHVFEGDPDEEVYELYMDFI